MEKVNRERAEEFWQKMCVIGLLRNALVKDLREAVSYVDT